MEILILVAALVALDVVADLLGPDTRDVESALESERVPVRRDAWLAERPVPWDRR